MLDLGKGAEKLTHFLELVNFFHLPIVQFVDIPGFMIGRKAEADGTIRKGTEHGACFTCTRTSDEERLRRLAEEA